jgi:hypothetical protein
MPEDDEPQTLEGVGDGRKKFVTIVTKDGKRLEEGDAYFRHADDAFIVSSDPAFDPSATQRFPKDELRAVTVNQHHSNCFLTTAVADDGATLDALREFRDDALTATLPGRALVRAYYAVSPPVATTLERHPGTRTARLVRTLVEWCAFLARRRRTAAPAGRLTLSLLLTALYVFGVTVAVVGHAVITTGERENDVN